MVCCACFRLAVRIFTLIRESCVSNPFNKGTKETTLSESWYCDLTGSVAIDVADDGRSRCWGPALQIRGALDGDADARSVVAAGVGGAEFAAGPCVLNADVVQCVFASSRSWVGAHGVFEQVANAVFVSIASVGGHLNAGGISTEVGLFPSEDGVNFDGRSDACSAGCVEEGAAVADFEFDGFHNVTAGVRSAGFGEGCGGDDLSVAADISLTSGVSAIDVVTSDVAFGAGGPGHGSAAVVDFSLDVGGSTNGEEAEGWVAHQSDVSALEVVTNLEVSIGGLVHGSLHALTNGAAKSHSVEVEDWAAGPHAGEGNSVGCDHAAEDVVSGIPVAVVAAEMGVEHRVHFASGQAAGGADAFDAAVAAVSDSAADQAGGSVAEEVAVNQVGAAEAGGDGAAARSSEGFTHESEIVIHQSAAGNFSQTSAEVVVLVEVAADQVSFGHWSEGREVGEIDAANAEFHGAWEAALVEFAITWDVAVFDAGGGCVVDAAVGPDAIDVAVETIARPGTFVLWMGIRIDVAAVRNGDVAEEDDALHVASGCVAGDDLALHGGDAVGGGNGELINRPAFTDQVVNEAVDLGGSGADDV